MERPRVAASKRTLEFPDGTPFFWMGDTAWELFHRLTKEEALRYLDARAEQEYNVIQAVALAELDGVRVPNREGHLPLVDQDPTRLNEPYWEHVDWVIDHAAQRGIYTALLPTWGDKVIALWGAGPEIFNEQNARVFGRLVAERYRQWDSVIWVNGGDRPQAEPAAIWRALAAGLIEGDGGKTRLMTFHPMGCSSSSEVFHSDDWLDFNMLQTGHGTHEFRTDKEVTKDYIRNPVKPVLDAEPRYENHPLFNDRTMPYFNAWDVRRAVAQGLFAGGCGFTYGCHAVWQMANDHEPKINAPIGTWESSLHLPGAKTMKNLKNLMLSLGYQKMKPAPEVFEGLAEDVRTLASDDTIAALVPAGIMPPLHPKLPGGSWKCHWHNLHTEEKVEIGEVSGSISQPSWGDREDDWVLILRK